MERAPFPDVTGLRIRARERDEFVRTGPCAGARRWGRAALACDVGREPLAVAAAAWGHILYRYMSHECTQVAFDVVDGARAVPVAVGDTGDAAALLAAVSAALRSAPQPVQGPTAVVCASDEAHALCVAAALPPCVTVALLVHAAGLVLLAAPSVHVYGSALVQLQQVHAVMCALQHASTDLFAALPAPLQSLAHPHPVCLPTEPHERLEDTFRRRARQHPDVPALTCCVDAARGATESWSYARLDARSDAIAARLRAEGVGVGDDEVVALCMSKCFDMYASILGVLKAGAAWCPIDPTWPAARQAALLDKSEARVVLADAAPPGSSLRVVRLCEVACADHAREVLPHRTASTRSPLAYKIWTSGTTGLPKAVGIEHAAAVQGMRALQAAVPTTFEPCEPGALRYLQFAAYVFDLSIFDMFYTWAHGGTVCFAPLDLLLTRLVDVAVALRVTHALFTPAVSAMVPRRAIPTMRLVINGGEKLSEAVADEWTRDCRLVNIYGPAEATLSLTMREPTHGDSVKAHNIGVPFDTALCVVLDGHGHVAPLGAIGELLLGGPQLARGYIGDADKTRDKFVEHPGLGRLYHTGDLARRLWDGQFEYLGRNDDQVKIHGVRIELLEINAAVKAAAPAVRDADTVAMPGASPDEPPRIVAFAVCPAHARAQDAHEFLRTDDEAAALARALREGAQRLLPAYMVPFHFLVLSAFPRTSSAKIDRRAVRAAYDALDLVAWEARVAGGDARADDAAVLAHPLAQAIVARLPALCGAHAAQVRAHVPLQALGLNSVRAMALSAQLQAAGHVVSAADLVQHGSLAALVAAGAPPPPRAVHVDAAHVDAARAAVRAPHRVQPATPLQQGMLLETRIDPTRYWMHRVFPLRTDAGGVPADRMRAAWAVATRTYDCLRTGFVRVGDGADGAPMYVAVVHEAGRALDVLDVDARDDAAALAALRRGDPADGHPPAYAAVLTRGAPSFALVLHHALYDAATLDLVAQCVDGALAGPPPPRAPPLADALGDLLPTDDTFRTWDAALRGYPRAHRIAFPVLRGTRAPPAGAVHRSVRRASTTWSALERAAADLGASVRPLAQLAWARVLCAYMDTECVLLGDVASQRVRRAAYATVGGPLLATLAVPVDLRARGSVRAHAAALDAFHRAVRDCASVPLAHVRAALEVPRDRPLLESLFVLEAEDAPPARRVLGAPRDLGVAVEHALALEVRVCRDGALELALNWADRVLCAPYAALLLAQVDAMLGAALDAPVDELPPALARDAALVARPLVPSAPAPRYANVAAWAAHHAARTPDAVAVECAGAELSYAALDAQSAALAAALQRFPPRSVVAVALPRSLATYVCLVGVLRAGMVYLPLDEMLPPARRAELVQDSGAVAVLGDEAVPGARLLRPHQVPLRPFAEAAPADEAAPAYLLYTSGSTGRPKGCRLTHGNLAAAIDNFSAAIEDAAPGSLRGARVLARSAEAFDVHLLECFLALQAGATVVTMPRAALLADLGAAMARAAVTHACVVPSLFYTRGRRPLPADLPALRVLIVGGEKMADDIADTWGDAVPVLNAYGPTEATIGISCARVRRAMPASEIGSAFRGNAFFVRTPRGYALRGAPGELCIAGTHVGAGYVGHAARLDAPFFVADGLRAYATGDRARLGPAGAEYLGRCGDAQVKVRGARVELDEVDAAVRAAGAYAHVATLLLTHAELAEPHLVAFVAHRAALGAPHLAPADVAPLYAALRARVSSYMVPSAIVGVSHLPLARVSGKLDRRALAELYAAHARRDMAAADDAAPQTPAEHAVSRVVGDVLALRAPPSVGTDLLALGLDSMRAVRLAARLEDAGLAVSLAELMRAPTIAAIARAARRGAARDAPPGHPAPAPIPALPLQEATLAASLAAPEQRLYVLHMRLPPSRAALDAWAAVLARHAIFCTVFVEADRTLVQEVRAPPPCTVAAALCTRAACDAVADDMIAHIASRPPVRVVLYDDALCVSMHHAVYDAVSLRLVRADVDAALCGTPPSGASDALFAAIARAAHGDLGAAAAHYAAELDGFVATPCPALGGRYEARAPPSTATYVPRVSAAQLRAAAAARRVTPPALALHAWASLLAQYAGEDEATLGVVLSGRMGAAAHALAQGPCVTTVPFRWRAGDDVRASHAQLTRALRHPFVRLPDVARTLGVQGALFDVLFSFLPEDAGGGDMATGLPLALQVVAAADVCLELVYTADRVPHAQAALLVRQVADVLERECRAACAIDGAESCPDALLSIVNPAPVEPTDADAFLALFSAHAAAAPDAEAVTFATSVTPLAARTLTYAELDAASDAFAAQLVRRAGAAAYVHLERGLPWYIALLAAWKAGKTYVPLDPALPHERLAHMVGTVGDGTLVSGAADAAHLAAAHRLDGPLAPPALAPPRGPPAPPRPRAALHRPAYILFTSGSTGKPKGVQVSHRALAGAILSWRRMLPHTRASRLLQLASPGFDVSLFEVCFPLAAGFAIGSAPKDVLLTDLEAAFGALRITMADLPAALAALVRPGHVPPCEWLMSGGDMIDERVVRAWGAPPHGLVNAYGPTEGTIGNTLGFIDARTRRTVVGAVYPATSLHVMRGSQLAYAGAVGELVVGGPQVADGYVGAPELTAARFVTVRGQRAYRTGDRGRVLADGRVECLGRMERGQVKVNGQRVELGEIAHELAVEPGVADAAVLYEQHPAMPARQLVAFVAMPSAAGTDPEPCDAAAAVVAGAARRLAPYMVPAHVLAVRALPLTPNNKVDVALLARMFASVDPAALRGAPTRAAPLTPRETAVVRVVRAMTGADVDRDASLYAVGIDSLSAIRLVRELRAAGIVVSVAALLQAGTPARIAAASGAVGDADAAAYAAAAAAAAASLPGASPLPCTPLQSGMLAQTVASRGALYVYTHEFEATAPVDTCVAAWEAVVAQNAILQTTFHEANGWVQVVRAARAPVHRHDVLHLDALPPLDVSRAPHELHVAGTRLVLRMHHALYDAHALAELLSDWDAAVGGTPPPARPPFAALLPRLAAGSTHVAPWVATLDAYVPRALLPPGAPRAACAASVAVPVRVAAAEAACARACVTMHTLATVAFAQLLAACTRRADVCFGQVLSLRGDVPEAVRAIGPALNTVPTRVKLCAAPSVAARLRAVQAATDALRPHRHAPLRAIAAAHARAQRTSAPLIDALLDVQRHDEPVRWAHLSPVPAAHEDDVQYTLNVAFVQRGDALELVGSARRAWADASRLRALLEQMAGYLDAMVADMDAPVAAAQDAPGDAPGDALGDAPATAALCALVAEVAGVDAADVTPDTPLLAVGVDSIAAIRLVAIARTRGCAVSYEDMAAGTPRAAAASLARRAEAAPSAGAGGGPTAAEAGTCAALVDDPLAHVAPATASQVAHLAALANSHYRAGLYSFAFDAAERLDAARLADAWTRLQARHAILRTVFAAAPAPVQLVVDATRPLGIVHDARDAHAACVDVMRRRAAPRDAMRAPLAWADLVHAADGDALVLTLFHAMYDAWSLPLLIADLVALYRGAPPTSVCHVPPAPAPPARDIATHWALLADATPTLLGHPPTADDARDTFVMRAGALDGADVRARAARLGVSATAALAAAWALVLHAETHTSCPVLGTYQHGRIGADAARDAAPRLVLQPLAVPVGAPRDMARHVAAALREPFPGVSLVDVHAALRLAPAPLWNTALNVLWAPEDHAHDALLRPARVGLELLHTRPQIATHSSLDAWPQRHCYAAAPIAIDIDLARGDMALRCASRVLSAAEAARLLDALAASLTRVLP